MSTRLQHEQGLEYPETQACKKEKYCSATERVKKALKIDLSVDGAFLEMAEYGPWKMVLLTKSQKLLRSE